MSGTSDVSRCRWPDCTCYGPQAPNICRRASATSADVGEKSDGLETLEAETIERAIGAAEHAGNFGDYTRDELTAEYGQPRFDMMNDIIAAIRNLEPRK